MKRVYSDSEKEFVEAIVELFIIIPNPEIRGYKSQIMKEAFNVLDDMDVEVEVEDDEPLSKEEIEVNEWYYKYLVSQSEEYEEE